MLVCIAAGGLGSWREGGGGGGLEIFEFISEQLVVVGAQGKKGDLLHSKKHLFILDFNSHGGTFPVAPLLS